MGCLVTEMKKYTLMSAFIFVFFLALPAGADDVTQNSITNQEVSQGVPADSAPSVVAPEVVPADSAPLPEAAPVDADKLNRQGVLDYLAQITYVEDWERTKGEEIHSSMAGEPRYSVRRRTLTADLNKKYLSVLKSFKVSNIPELQEDLDKRINLFDVLMQISAAWNTKDKEALDRLHMQQDAIQRAIDDGRRTLVQKYSISIRNIKEALSSHKVDIKWIDEIIKE
ncbi:MAG: hypothetical protein HQL17_06870 [Candidatus Omnitrophica bacterium]|nr:hypothetical protein [Candidatus Omnitrophota bacterium]